MALEMILGIEIFKDSGEGSRKVASVVPLAFPMIAGAGTMTSLISLRAEFELVNILIAIFSKYFGRLDCFEAYVYFRANYWRNRNCDT